MDKKPLLLFLRFAAIAGNVLFILWVSFNAMDEGFNGTLIQKLSYFGLMGLLAMNTFFLLEKPQQNFTIKQKSN